MPSIQKKRDVIAELFRKQDGKCWLCNGQMKLKTYDEPNSATLDHITPKSEIRGPGRHKGNVRAACWICNAIRGNNSAKQTVTEAEKQEWIKNSRTSWKLRFARHLLPHLNENKVQP